MCSPLNNIVRAERCAMRQFPKDFLGGRETIFEGGKCVSDDIGVLLRRATDCATEALCGVLGVS
jgi:hypothetical protein